MEVAISRISDFMQRGLSRDWMPGNKNKENRSICAQFQFDGCGESFLRKRRPDGDLCSFNCPRHYSQLSSSHTMSQNRINFVYKRRRQNSNSTICTAQPGVVIKPVRLVAAHEYETSVLELVTEANRSLDGHPVEYNKGVSELHDGIVASEETGSKGGLISNKGGILNVTCAKDDCSSPKSNMNLSSAFLRFDKDGACECSSSGACINENLPADMSERDQCISILRSQGLCERLRTTHNQASAENIDMGGEKYCSKRCKICDNLESTSKMLVCDDCEDSFHLSCCNPLIMRIPVGEWLCSSCLKKKNHKILKDKSTIHSVNLTNVFRRNEISESEGELGSMEFLFRDTEPYMSNVKIGDKFQADVLDWPGPIDDECDLIGDRLEITSPNNLILQERNSVRTLKLSSIGNWLQCQEVIEGIGEGVDGTICGKWRRAPLFEVQTDGWACFDSVHWDPTHSDCAVPQELGIEEVMKQMKYIEKLRPQLAAKSCDNGFPKSTS